MAIRCLMQLFGAVAVSVCGSAQAASPDAVEAAHGMVVSAQHLASDVGLDILKQGGNAIDAAVAVGYAEAVVNPCCGNIGGGGFMVVRLADGRDRFINFRETAPAASSRDMYLDTTGNAISAASKLGYKSAAVPGTVMGLDQALREFGKLPRATVMAPAIRLARDGFILTRGDTDLLNFGSSRFGGDPVAAKIFLKQDGSAFQPGDRLVQKDLAATLERIAQLGPDGFYKGKVADALVHASVANGGIFSDADFAAYRVTEAEPLRCRYRDYVVLSAPPPSSGGTTLCEILSILQGYDLHALGFHSAAAVHVMVEAMRHAYVDRNMLLGDPAFVTNPIDHLLSPDYAAAIRAKILPDKATPSLEIAPGTPPHEKTETTHYSVVDQDGNAVAVTYTINGAFGANVIAPGTGFFLNDEMDDFTVKPGVANMFGLVQGQRNLIEPGKRPLSSMAPTIITKDGHAAMVLGSPGGSRIISIVLETALNVIDYGMTPGEAVDAPRLHHQWLPDVIAAEPFALSPDTVSLLKSMGYRVEEEVPWGAAEMIEIGLPMAAGTSISGSGDDQALSGRLIPGLLYGANDVRRPAGSAVGY